MSKEKIPPLPEKPTPHECCGSGCVPCIYDYYYDALDKWNAQYGKDREKLTQQNKLTPDST